LNQTGPRGLQIIGIAAGVVTFGVAVRPLMYERDMSETLPAPACPNPERACARPATTAGLVLGALLGLPALLDLPSTGWTGHRGAPLALPIEALVIDANLASEELLAVLPGVGPVLARRIAEERGRMPFADAADLIRAHGIGPATVDRLRAHLRFGPSRPSPSAHSMRPTRVGARVRGASPASGTSRFSGTSSGRAR
jgi:hypothetical protein